MAQKTRRYIVLRKISHAKRERRYLPLNYLFDRKRLKSFTEIDEEDVNEATPNFLQLTLDNEEDDNDDDIDICS